MEELRSCPSNKDIPEHLYHYTSIEGVKGIVTGPSLWATQIQYLNDTQEFTYAVDIFRKVLIERKKQLAKTSGPTLWSPLIPSDPRGSLGEFYNTIELFLVATLASRTRICVFSFSKWGDQLSQWRGYCPNGGYSIGFCSELLIQFLKNWGLHIKPCMYEEDEQQNLVDGFYSKWESSYLNSLNDAPREFRTVPAAFWDPLFEELLKTASIFKHPSFYEECEWRIFSNPIPIEDISFKVKGSKLIPYYSISLRFVEHLPIDEVIVGPQPEQELARYSLEQFLVQKGLIIRVKPSDIPYRVL